MKTLITVAASFVAVLATYVGADNTSNLLGNQQDDRRQILVGQFCPTSQGLITRDLREEGVILKIQTQAIKSTNLISNQNTSE